MIQDQKPEHSYEPPLQMDHDVRSRGRGELAYHVGVRELDYELQHSAAQQKTRRRVPKFMEELLYIVQYEDADRIPV